MHAACIPLPTYTLPPSSPALHLRTVPQLVRVLVSQMERTVELAAAALNHHLQGQEKRQEGVRAGGGGADFEPTTAGAGEEAGLGAGGR